MEKLGRTTSRKSYPISRKYGGLSLVRAMGNPARPSCAIGPGSGLIFEPVGRAGLEPARNKILAGVGPDQSGLTGLFRARAGLGPDLCVPIVSPGSGLDFLCWAFSRPGPRSAQV